MNFTILLNKINTPNVEQMDNAELGSFGTFDEFQTALINVVTSKKAHAAVFNARGKEIFSIRYSPACSEGVCCMWQDSRRLNRFISQF